MKNDQFWNLAQSQVSINDMIQTLQGKAELGNNSGIANTEPRGIARNLLRGQKRGSGDGSPPVVSRGTAMVGVWGETPRKPETHAEYSTEQNK